MALRIACGPSIFQYQSEWMISLVRNNHKITPEQSSILESLSREQNDGEYYYAHIFSPGNEDTKITVMMLLPYYLKSNRVVIIAPGRNSRSRLMDKLVGETKKFENTFWGQKGLLDDSQRSQLPTATKIHSSNARGGEISHQPHSLIFLEVGSKDLNSCDHLVSLGKTDLVLVDDCVKFKHRAFWEHLLVHPDISRIVFIKDPTVSPKEISMSLGERTKNKKKRKLVDVDNVPNKRAKPSSNVD